MMIVDSSSWIEALRANGDAEVRRRVENLLDSGEAAWCPIIQLELWRGVRNGKERSSLEFLEGRIDLLEIGTQVWNGARELMLKARSSGLLVPVADVIIVATARFHGAGIEHCDQHFDKLLKIFSADE